MNDSTTPLKRCNLCGTEYPLTAEFWYRHKRHKSGFTSECKNCAKARARRWAAENPERLLSNVKRYQTEHPEAARARKRKHYDNNKDKIKARARQWNRENPERFKQAVRAYAQSEKARVVFHRRRARLRNLPDRYTATDVERMMNYWNYCCAFCGNQQDFWHTLEREHWIPVTDMRPDNPGTVPSNMLPSCKSCNSSKFDHDPIEWLNAKFGKRKAEQILERINTYFAQVCAD